MTMKKINNIRRCRLCACEESFDSFSNIFDDNPESELEIKITKLLPVVVMPWDPMPHIVCHDCISKLNSFNDFYEASLRAERFFRTFHPSAPELENLEPVVHVMDHSVRNRTALKLPPKKRQGVSADPEKTAQETAEVIEILDAPDDEQDAAFQKKTLNSFIVNQITTTDSVFTCRNCYRTFTKQSSALSHSCGKLETLDGNEEKYLPPLKIRLFSMRSGLFVCYLCQTTFESKAELVEHLKEHFAGGEAERKCKQKGRRKGRHKEEDAGEHEKEEDFGKTPGKKRRKSPEVPKKRGRKKNACEKCGKVQKGSVVSSTMEQMTQCSEIASSSQTKEPEVVESSSAESSTEREVKSGIFEASCSLEDPTEVRKAEEEEDDDDETNKSDEVTVLEVINNRTPTSFSSCVFCDKIFATKDALIAHQNKHLQGCPGVKTSTENEEAFLCSVCAMMFTSRKTLAEHEQFHAVEDPAGSQRKIRISLSPERLNQECQISNGRGIIRITVTSRENKIPQIEFI